MLITARFRVIYFLIAVSPVICSCTPSVLPTEELKKISQYPKIHAVHNPPRLAFTFFPEEGFKGEAIGKYFGPMGLFTGAWSDIRSAQALGDKLVQGYGLQDPVLRVKSRSIDLLARENFRNIQPYDSQLPEDDLGNLKQKLDSDMVMDFKTITWVLASNPKDPKRYLDSFRARSRLIRVEDGKVLWEGECGFKKHDPKSALTIDEMLDNQGTLLKTLFQEDADACADEIVSQFLGRASQ